MIMDDGKGILLLPYEKIRKKGREIRRSNICFLPLKRNPCPDVIDARRANEGLSGKFSNLLTLRIRLFADIEKSEIHEVHSFECLLFLFKTIFADKFGNIALCNISLLPIRKNLDLRPCGIHKIENSEKISPHK